MSEYQELYEKYVALQKAKSENADPYQLWLRKHLNPDKKCTKCRRKANYLSQKGVRLK